MERIRRLDTLRVLDNDGVACVVATCAARTDVRIRSKDVDELAFAFVAPLGAEDSRYFTQNVRLCFHFKGDWHTPLIVVLGSPVVDGQQKEVLVAR